MYELLPCIGMTAVTFVDKAYKVQRGEYYLVHTVAGGLGLCLAQVISARGGIVIGTTSTAEKAEIAKAHGATHVILYKSENVVARVLEITNGEGVHAIFDGVGKDTYVVPSCSFALGVEWYSRALSAALTPISK